MRRGLKGQSFKGNQGRRILMKLPISALVVLTCMFVLAAAPKAQAEECSNASLRGAYGFHGFATIAPAGTPRAIIGVFEFDGQDSWTATLTVNDNGTISHPRNTTPATYIVNADCTGTLLPSTGGSVEIVVVDGGREFYQMRTDPSTIVLYGVTKKLFRGNQQ
jgi:hypothetical protein